MKEYCRCFIKWLCKQISADSCIRIFLVVICGALGAYVYSIHNELINKAPTVAKFDCKMAILGSFASLVGTYIFLSPKNHNGMRFFVFALLFGFFHRTVFEAVGTYIKSGVGGVAQEKGKGELMATAEEINKLPTGEVFDKVEKTVKTTMPLLFSREQVINFENEAKKVSKEAVSATLRKSPTWSNIQRIESFVKETRAINQDKIANEVTKQTHSMVLDSPDKFSGVLALKGGYYPFGSNMDSIFNEKYKAIMIRNLSSDKGFVSKMVSGLPRESWGRYFKYIENKKKIVTNEQEIAALSNLAEALGEKLDKNDGIKNNKKQLEQK